MVFYNLEKVANLLDIHVDTIRRYVREGKLQAYKIGKGYRVKKEDFEKFLEERKQ